MSERRAGCRPRILIVDDDPALLRVLVRRLGRRYTVVALTSARRALEIMDAGLSFDAVVCDVLMPGMTGAGFLLAVEERNADLAARIVFITGALFSEPVARFLDAVANRRVEKPWKHKELDAAIEEALRSAA